MSIIVAVLLLPFILKLRFPANTSLSCFCIYHTRWVRRKFLQCLKNSNNFMLLDFSTAPSFRVESKTKSYLGILTIMLNYVKDFKMVS